MKSDPGIKNSGKLTESQLTEFQKNGFLEVPGFLSLNEVRALREQAEVMVNESDLSEASRFSTEEHALTSELFFIESGDKIRCFFEEDAFDQQGNLKQDKLKSINKIGHALHDIDPVFSKATYSVNWPTWSNHLVFRIL